MCVRSCVCVCVCGRDQDGILCWKYVCQCWLGEPEVEYDVWNSWFWGLQLNQIPCWHLPLSTRVSSASTVTRLQAGETSNRGSAPDKTFPVGWKRSDYLWAISALYSIGTRVLSPSGVQLTQQLRIKPKLRTRGDVHPSHPYASTTCMEITFIIITHNSWTWVIRICFRLA